MQPHDVTFELHDIGFPHPFLERYGVQRKKALDAMSSLGRKIKVRDMFPFL